VEYGLRDYGESTETVWDADPRSKCEHEWGSEIVERRRGAIHGPNAQVGNTLSGLSGVEVHQGQFCAKCGAFKGQLGLEPDWRMYVAHLVQIFREVKRVLKKTGSLYLVMGDTYAGSNRGSNKNGTFAYNPEKYPSKVPLWGPPIKTTDLPAKCLMGIPWRAAFALIEDGWILRNDIIWCLDGNTPMVAKVKGEIWRGTLKELSKVGGRIFLPTLRKGDATWVEVERIWKSEETKGLKVILTNGLSFITNENHRFPVKFSSRKPSKYIKIKVKPLKDIKKGHLLYLANSFPYIETKNELTYEEGFAIGFYLAEGNLIRTERRNKGSEYSLYALERWAKAKRYPNVQEYLKNRDDVIGVELSCGLLDKRYLSLLQKKYRIKAYEYGANLAVRSYDPTYVESIKKFCLGENANNKHLSPEAYLHGLAFMRGILDGFLCGDGYNRGRHGWRVKITNNSALTNDILLLSKFLGYEFRQHQEKNGTIGFSVYKRKPFNSFKDSSFQTIRKIEPVDNVELYEVAVKPLFGSYRGKMPTPRGRTKQERLDKWNDLFCIGNGVLTHNCKPNAMPSSVKDRLTQTYEHIFHLVKQGRYYYDLDAIRIPHKSVEEMAKYYSEDPIKKAKRFRRRDSLFQVEPINRPTRASRDKPGAYEKRQLTKHDRAVGRFSGSYADPLHVKAYNLKGKNPGDTIQALEEGDFWSIHTEPSYDYWCPNCKKFIRPKDGKRCVFCGGPLLSHFAPYPKAICVKPIRASSPENGIVLDPMCGSGTTLLVAKMLGRRFIGIDLDPSYVEMAKARLASVPERLSRFLEASGEP
jgi:hypothetical protein